MQRRITVGAALALTLTAALILSGCAPSQTATGGSGSSSSATPNQDFTSMADVIDAYPVKDVCGTKKLTIAYPMGITNDWMKQTLTLLKRTAAQCPNIKPIATTDAQVDQQKAVSDVNSLVAQGVNGIITLPIFADAQVPSFRAAQQAGVPVVTTHSPGIGQIPTDVTAQITADTQWIGEQQAKWLHDNLKSGTVIFLGNAPGQPSSIAFFTAFKKALAQYPELKLVEPDFVPTNNSAVDKKNAMTAMLAKHGRIDAVVTDNGATDPSVVQAYDQAGLKLPYLATADVNSMGCLWEKEHFPMQAMDGTNELASVGLYFLLAKINGIKVNKSTSLRGFVSVDTESGKNPKCDASIPAGADWSTGLSAADMKKILG